MVAIIAQPIWSSRVCEEIYQFELPFRISDLLLRIEAFYRWRELRDVVRTEAALRFVRGRSHAFNFSFDERAHEHEVTVKISGDIRPLVVCHYLCRIGLFDFRVAPHKLQSEVEELVPFHLSNAGGNEGSIVPRD